MSFNAEQIGNGSVSNAEFEALNGVSSSIQDQLDGLSAVDQVAMIHTVPTGTKNGSNLVFTMAAAITDGDLVTRNGQVLQPTVDYTAVGTTLTFITFAPESDDVIEVRRINGNAFGAGDPDPFTDRPTAQFISGMFANENNPSHTYLNSLTAGYAGGYSTTTISGGGTVLDRTRKIRVYGTGTSRFNTTNLPVQPDSWYMRDSFAHVESPLNTVGRRFTGMTPSVMTDVDPTTRANVIGIFTKSADTTQWYLVHSDGGASGTSVATGIPITNNLLELQILKLRAGCWVRLRDVETNDVWDHQATTNLPDWATELYFDTVAFGGGSDSRLEHCRLDLEYLCD